MDLAGRPYEARDLAGVKDVVVAARAASPRTTSMHAGDVDWRFFGPHGFPLGEIVRVWEGGQGIVAWALLSASGFDYQVHPAAPGEPLERAIVGWGQAETWRWQDSQGMKRTCSVECSAEDAARITLLTRLGYKRSDRRGVHFRRSLDGPLPDPRPPDGWQVRGLRADDVEGRAAVQYEAFAPGSKTTPQTWRHLMANAPGYDAGLDSIAVRDDGTVGAAALAWLDPVNRVGEFEPVGTRPAFQRRGLARAVLSRGLRQMRDRGMETAIVQTNATNAPAIAAYRSVGFAQCGELVEYEISG